MSKNPAIYTRTMAKVFTQQGHYDRAIEVYHYLLKQNPDQPDVIDAIKDAEQQQLQRSKADCKELSVLVSEWIELLHKYRLIKRLNRLWNKNEIRGTGTIDDQY